jgi:hypothetical protein
MPDYQKSKIYKLWSPSKNLVYYGSTTETISRRLSKHITDDNRYNNKITTRYVNSFKILECNDYKIELVEEYPCNNRQQLCKKEGEHIKANECVNKCVAGRTAEEYYQDNIDKIKEYDKKYKEDNADKIKQYREDNRQQQKDYRENNKDKIKENGKKWRDDNADKKKEMDKKYRDENIDKINEKRKQYRETNADKIKERNKIYRDANADKIKERRRQKYLKQKEVKIEIIENV